MPALITVYTDTKNLGIAQMPVYVIGDDQNWSLRFSDGVNIYNPVGVSMRFGYVGGLDNLTFTNAFDWIDRMNNRHIGSFVIAAGVPGTLTWDEDPISVLGGSGAWLLKGRTPPSSQIRKVNVVHGGSGLSAAPRVDFNAGWATLSGKGATGTAVLTTQTVTSVTVTNPGHNYSTPPFVFFNGGGGSGAQARATLTSGQVTAVSVLAAGSGYTSTPTVTFIDPEASATATVGGTSTVTALVLGAGGAGYTSAPTVAFAGGGGSSAAATAAIADSSWPVASLALTAAGSDFTSAPTVAFSGGGGSGAEAVATITANRQVTAIPVTNAGDYVEGSSVLQPGIAITFSGGGGSGAAATAVIEQVGASGHWSIKQINVTNGGSGYTSPPTVVITPNARLTAVVAATATATVSTGVVTTLTLTNAGTGYTSAPTVTISGGGGTGATATAALVGSPVVSLTITNAGSGYTSAPAVSFSGGSGTGAAAIAKVNLGVTGITLVQSGFAYTSLPSVTLYPGAGTILEACGIETHPVPFLRNYAPASAVSALAAIPFSHGRQDSSGNLIYDDSILIIKPRTILEPTLTLQGDGLTWAGVFTPVTDFVRAVLNLRRTCVVDVEIYGGGRLLYQGKLSIINRSA